jgi:hypothetical protein
MYNIKYMTALNLLRKATYLTSHGDIYNHKMNIQKSNYQVRVEGGKKNHSKQTVSMVFETLWRQ